MVTRFPLPTPCGRGPLAILAPPSPSRPVGPPGSPAPRYPRPPVPQQQSGRRPRAGLGGLEPRPKAPEWGGNQSAPRGGPLAGKLAGAAPPNARPKHLGGEGLSLMGLERPGDLPISGPRPRVPYVLHRWAAPTCPLSRHLPAHGLFPQSEWGCLAGRYGWGTQTSPGPAAEGPGNAPAEQVQSPTPYTSTPLGATPLGGLPPLESVAGHTHPKWSGNLRVPSSQTTPHRCFSHLPLRVMVVWSQPLPLSNQLPFPSLFSQVYLLEGSRQRRTRGYSTPLAPVKPLGEPQFTC